VYKSIYYTKYNMSKKLSKQNGHEGSSEEASNKAEKRYQALQAKIAAVSDRIDQLTQLDDTEMTDSEHHELIRLNERLELLERKSSIQLDRVYRISKKYRAELEAYTNRVGRDISEYVEPLDTDARQEIDDQDQDLLAELYISSFDEHDGPEAETARLYEKLVELGYGSGEIEKMCFVGTNGDENYLARLLEVHKNNPEMRINWSCKIRDREMKDVFASMDRYEQQAILVYDTRKLKNDAMYSEKSKPSYLCIEGTTPRDALVRIIKVGHFNDPLVLNDMDEKLQAKLMQRLHTMVSGIHFELTENLSGWHEMMQKLRRLSPSLTSQYYLSLLLQFCIAEKIREDASLADPSKLLAYVNSQEGASELGTKLTEVVKNPPQEFFESMNLYDNR
jgi:hypothetical protein